MKAAMGQLSNREIALLIWLVVLLVAIVVYRPAWPLLGPIFKLIFFLKVTVVLLAMLAYVTFMALIFHWLRLAHWWMLKDALFWFFGTAIILLSNTSQAGKEDHFIRKIAVDTLKFAVILDFVINLYVFNLAVELILLPFLAVLAMLAVVATTKKEYKPVEKFINRLIAAIGIGFPLYALVNILDDPGGFATLKNLEDFLTPMVLTLTILPFIYGVTLYGAYEQMLVQASFRIRGDKELLSYAKRQIVMACGFSLKSVNRFAKDYVHKLGGARYQGEVLDVISAFKVSLPGETGSD